MPCQNPVLLTSKALFLSDLPWFSSEPIRLDRRPGDQLVVFCNKQGTKWMKDWTESVMKVKERMLNIVGVKKRECAKLAPLPTPNTHTHRHTQIATQWGQWFVCLAYCWYNQCLKWCLVPWTCSVDVCEINQKPREREPRGYRHCFCFPNHTGSGDLLFHLWIKHWSSDSMWMCVKNLHAQQR